MIYILSSKKPAAFGLSGKDTWAEIEPIMPPAQAEKKFKSSDQVYFDASAISPAEIKKTVKTLAKNNIFWGVIDPKGAAEDPASFFFDGASDYIGSALVKKGLSKKRVAQALSWAEKSGAKDSGKGADKAGEGVPASKRKYQKLPAGKFEGWKSIRTGTKENFFFLFASIGGKTNLRSMVGEAVFNTIMNRWRDVLFQELRKADALPWMETEANSLFLVPAKSNNCKAAIEAALKMIVGSRLIGIEKLLLTIPVEFIFALHYGETVFQAPGKTGAIVSESVNYIFHLGAKKAEEGRLTISDDVSDEAIPETMQNIFLPIGTFEGIPIKHSRRFVYE
jgi:hypothetical protein